MEFVFATLSAAPANTINAGERTASWIYNNYLEESLDASFQVVPNGRFAAPSPLLSPIYKGGL